MQRPVLVHIHRFARSRRANPYAVLGAVLRRAITLVPPRVQLPASGVGDVISVNLFTTNVGRSGQGKDIANGVGREAVVFRAPDGERLDDPPRRASGPARAWPGCSRATANADRPRGPRVHLQVNEVATLEALADRKGDTLVG